MGGGQSFSSYSTVARGKASVKWGVYLCDEDVRVCYAVEGGAGVSRVKLLYSSNVLP